MNQNDKNTLIANTQISTPIIGIHTSPLVQKFGTPRQPNLVDVHTHIEMLQPYNTLDAFTGIEAFSHLWITWQFHLNKLQSNFRPQVRPPRLGGNKKLGVFATRSMYRPSGLGLSVVQFRDIQKVADKVILSITGADMVNDTPIIDIKPYISYSDSIMNTNSGFVTDEPITKPLQKQVLISLQARQAFEKLIMMNKINDLDIDIIQKLLAQDPRPAYRQKEIDTIFTMTYKDINISFNMDRSDCIQITRAMLVGVFK